METKLMIVEGIPGSGKTTTAQFVRDCVEQTGKKTLLYLENAPYHPVDLDNLSYVNENQYKRLLARFHQYTSGIDEITEKAKDGYFLHYLCLYDIYGSNMPDALIQELMKYDAHDTLAPETYHALLVERWKKIYLRANTRDETVIFECTLLQNPLTVFIGKHNYEACAVKSYILEFAELVHDLNPVLIYLHGDSVRETLQRVITTRPQAWIDLVITYITGQGFGKAHNLQGLEGVFSFYEMLKHQMEDIISDIDCHILTIDITKLDWERYNQIIADYIQCNL